MLSQAETSFLDSPSASFALGLLLLSIPPATLGTSALLRGPSASVYSLVFPFHSTTFTTTTTTPTPTTAAATATSTATSNGTGASTSSSNARAHSAAAAAAAAADSGAGSSSLGFKKSLSLFGWLSYGLAVVLYFQASGPSLLAATAAATTTSTTSTTSTTTAPTAPTGPTTTASAIAGFANDGLGDIARAASGYRLDPAAAAAKSVHSDPAASEEDPFLSGLNGCGDDDGDGDDSVAIIGCGVVAPPATGMEDPRTATVATEGDSISSASSSVGSSSSMDGTSISGREGSNMCRSDQREAGYV